MRINWFSLKRGGEESWSPKKSRVLGMCKLQILLEDVKEIRTRIMKHLKLGFCAMRGSWLWSLMKQLWCRGLKQTGLPSQQQRNGLAQHWGVSNPYSVMQSSRQLDKSGSLKLNHALQHWFVFFFPITFTNYDQRQASPEEQRDLASSWVVPPTMPYWT